MSDPVSELLEAAAWEVEALEGGPHWKIINGITYVPQGDHVVRAEEEQTSRRISAILGILRARLGPILEAGQAMRVNIGAYAVALNASPFVQADTMKAIRGCIDGLQAWEAALKGKQWQNSTKQ